VLKRRWSPSNHQTRSAIAENLQRLSVRQSLEQTSYAAERPRIPLAFVRAVAPWLHLHTGLLEPNIAHRALTNREPFRNAVGASLSIVNDDNGILPDVSATGGPLHTTRRIWPGRKLGMLTRRNQKSERAPWRVDFAGQTSNQIASLFALNCFHSCFHIDIKTDKLSHNRKGEKPINKDFSPLLVYLIVD
jgi:hypothetical protein